ncbi:MAG: NAD-dependent dehydratase, partial [Maribacter sp.]|nr:NAD-dependent dehydratase [Maribacter sp.]
DFICKVEPSFTGTLLADKGESVIFDNTKIKTFVPGFKATIPFAIGIKKTLKWLDENPDRKFINSDKNTKIENVLKAYKSIKF